MPKNKLIEFFVQRSFAIVEEADRDEKIEDIRVRVIDKLNRGEYKDIIPDDYVDKGREIETRFM